MVRGMVEAEDSVVKKVSCNLLVSKRNMHHNKDMKKGAEPKSHNETK
jgi:hypothetical protein